MSSGGSGDWAAIFASMFGEETTIPFEQVNEYTDQILAQIQDRLQLSDMQFDSLMRQVVSSANQLGGIGNAMKQLATEVSQVSVPSVDAGYNLYQQRQPQLTEQAMQVAERAYQPYRETAGAVADRRAGEAARDVMGQYGGQGYSGAAQAAASGAAADVLSDYETSVAAGQGQLGGALAGQALSQERSLAEQAPQTNFSNTINQLLNQSNVLGSAAGAIGNQGSLLSGAMNQEGNLINQLVGTLGGISMPQYMEPTIRNKMLETSQAISATEQGGLNTGYDIVGSIFGAL